MDKNEPPVIVAGLENPEPKLFKRVLKALGPGLVTGAADDDPSGIATYSQAGAGFGFGLLWAFPMMYPLLMAVQESCARIGAITGKGLAAVIKENYNKKLLYMSVGLVVVANTINIGSDLGAMAAATQLFVNAPLSAIVILYAIIIVLLEIFITYGAYARILKWLAVALLAYPLTALLIGQDWAEIFSNTFTLTPQINFQTIYIFVGMLGTTISPYLFFWNTSEIVEEEIIQKNISLIGEDPKATKQFLFNMQIDNFAGMTFASVTAWFIVIVCASTLYKSGGAEIITAADAARALEPLVQNFANAGFIAKLIFSIGIIGLGLLAVPILAASSSYAISEAMGWKEGLYRKYGDAKGFYGIIILATFAGLVINFLGINPIKALVFTAVFNGVAAVPLLIMIVKVGNNKKIMGNYKNGKISNFFISLALGLMASAVLVLFYAFIMGY